MANKKQIAKQTNASLRTIKFLQENMRGAVNIEFLAKAKEAHEKIKAGELEWDSEEATEAKKLFFRVLNKFKSRKDLPEELAEAELLPIS